MGRRRVRSCRRLPSIGNISIKRKEFAMLCDSHVENGSLDVILLTLFPTCGCVSKELWPTPFGIYVDA
uniref:Uncharacterized protein n=1 Tax=Cucumis melo TaxID=3656 RepID=A0A9I9E1C3_CUCME